MKVTAAFALTAVGGVAVATAGVLPELPGSSGFGPRPTALGDSPSPTPFSPAPSAPTPAGAAPAPSITPTPLPHPSAESLCQIFVADPRNRQAGSEVKGLDSQALAALIALAGGKVAEIWSYCSRMLSSAGAPPWPAAGNGQPWDQLRSYSTGPNDSRSHPPQPSQDSQPSQDPPPSQDPSQNQAGQSSAQAADRGISPTPTPESRSAHPSSPPGGRG